MQRRLIQGAEEGDSGRRGVPLPSASRREDKQRRASHFAGTVILGFKAQRRGIQGAVEFHRRRRGEGRTSRGGLRSLPTQLFFGRLLHCWDD